LIPGAHEVPTFVVGSEASAAFLQVILVYPNTMWLLRQRKLW
jgi:hypothetical protein